MSNTQPRLALWRSTAFVGAMLLSGLWQRAAGQKALQPANADANVAAITPSIVSLGDSIFHGKAAGGACMICHGADAKGTPGLAPNLTSGKWMHGDGSYASIVHTVETGVPDPKEASSPMPPMGGASLTPAQVRAVAAYIYSLNHRELPNNP